MRRGTGCALDPPCAWCARWRACAAVHDVADRTGPATGAFCTREHSCALRDATGRL